MKTQLSTLYIQNFQTSSNEIIEELSISYEIFGRDIHQAPVVLVNHALTGNSTVCGEQGWWKHLIGTQKCIDTDQYAVIAFNIPGNGYDQNPKHLIEKSDLFVARDIARIFLKGLEQLSIHKLFAIIGGSIGGSIAWEMAAIQPDITKYLIPVASDWKSTDWLKGCCLIQKHILENSRNPIHDARLHAMLLYRTPLSMEAKFQRSFNTEAKKFNVETWLLHHGRKLEERFQLKAYQLLNHILSNIDITQGTDHLEGIATTITAHIHIISIDSDGFFTCQENQKTYQRLKPLKKSKITSTLR